MKWISTEDETKWPPLNTLVLVVIYDGKQLQQNLARLHKKKGAINWYVIGGRGYTELKYVTHFCYLPMLPKLEVFTKYDF